jgi:hypothetical protein
MKTLLSTLAISLALAVTGPALARSGNGPLSASSQALVGTISEPTRRDFAMSAYGTFRTSHLHRRMSVVEGKADMTRTAARRKYSLISAEVPEPLFESPDGMAQRRLRNVDLRCGFRETALSRNGEEGKEIVDVLSRHS